MFIEKLVKTLNKYSCITHWEVENEPLDPSGPENIAVPIDFLIQEVELVRKFDNRPNIMTLWADDLESRKLFPEVLPISDVIGLDIYYKRFMKSDKGKSFYEGPRTNDNYLREIIKTSPKEVIITELQAEPWEKDEKGYLSKNPESMSPELLENNLKKALSLGVKEVLLRGFEYWYYLKRQGDNRYLKVIKGYL